MLNFQPEEILLFGWSIGGYSSLVAAAQYPNVKGVVRLLFRIIEINFSLILTLFRVEQILFTTRISYCKLYHFQILDATFDDVLQLAIPRMPNSLSGIVRIAIRDYINLNNIELINLYSGPVLLIRRTEDEIIAE